MSENLLVSQWANLDSHELRLLLHETIGGAGQIESDDKTPTKLYLPQARDSCKIVLAYKGNRIQSIEPGPAFDNDEWQQISAEINGSILNGPTKIGRDVSFSSHRVEGSWHGVRSGVQILPAPPDAPRAPVEIAQHPLLLEFPIKAADRWVITNHRRMREHSRLTMALNALLNARFSLQPRRPDHRWAVEPGQHHEAKWVQEFYFADFGQAVVEKISVSDSPQLEVLDAEEYYQTFGHDGEGLRVPSDLDDLIMRQQALKGEESHKFDRACYWMDQYARLWNRTASGSFASLVSAIEALTNRGDIHYFKCPECGDRTQHEKPGATKGFSQFLETYAPGKVLKKRRDEMYSIRSGILHGSKLMLLDQDLALGWDPPWWNENELHRDLAGVAHIAIRNWLKSVSG